MTRPLPAVLAATVCFLAVSRAAVGQERLCNTQFEDCRAPLLQLIRTEQVAIDVALWFIEDERYATELINRHNAGIPVRVLTDQRAVNSYGRYHPGIMARLRDAGIPLREKYTGNILHFKMMMFHGQNMLEFSKANYTDFSFVPVQPNVNYFDEAIYFTNDDRLTASFRRRFDDLWVNTTQYRNLANVGSLERRCPTCSIHPSMNFPPLENFANRSVARYNRETHGIDATVYRATDHRHPDAMIAAVARGVPVRIITEPSEYRNPERLWHSKQVDRMWLSGVQIKHRQHPGLTHQASVVLRGLGEVIFGSSNWTNASASYQDEHNYFYNPSLQKPWIFQWFVDQFDAKWNEGANYVPFQPLPPDNPAYYSPPPGAVGQSTSVTLTWDGGTWAHFYDIYFGTSPDPPLIAAGVETGSPVAGQQETYTVINLQPGTTYYWRVVSKTWAQVPNSGSVSSFTTSGTASSTPPPPPPIGAPFPESALVWHHAGTGNLVAWLMGGTTPASHAVIGQASPIWRIVGRGDFNGDGELDLLWQHSTNGSVVVWFMRGTTYLQSVVAGSMSDTTWKVVAADDFNRDGRADLVWYNSATGGVVIWTMNGTDYVRATTVGSVSDLNWRLSGAADLDSDGDPDLVWHHPPSGAVVAWLLNGTTYVGGAVMGSVSDPSWRLAGAADLDGDRFGDLIWYHENLQTVVAWLMHRATYRTGVAIGQVSDPNWRLEAPR